MTPCPKTNSQPGDGQVHPIASSVIPRHPGINKIRSSIDPKVPRLSHFGRSTRACPGWQKSNRPPKFERDCIKARLNLCELRALCGEVFAF
jgi:hypothetical protein